MTGSPRVTENPSARTATLREKALAVMRWQPVQWQAMVRRGGALSLNRTCPQRHPPSQGTLRSLIVRLRCRPATRAPSVRLLPLELASEIWTVR